MFQQRYRHGQGLVRQVLAGQRDAYGKLVDRYLAAAFSVAFPHTRNRLDAEDAAQEGFLRALQTLDRLRDPERFAPWLLTIVRNISVDIVAARERERKSGTKVASDDATWIPDMEKRDMWAKLHEQIQQLDDQHREVLMLFYFAGHSAKEIAGLLNTSHEAVRKRLQRAREALGARMLEEIEPKQALRPLLRARGTKITAAALAVPVTWQATASATAGGAGSAFVGGAAVKWLAGAALVCAGVAGYWATSRTTELPPATRSVTPGSSVVVSQPEPSRSAPNARRAIASQNAQSANAKMTEPSPAPPDGGIGVIRGRVETVNHLPIPGAQVLLHRATVDGHWVVDWTEKFRTATSAADGSFTFEGLPFESYDVLAAMDHALSWEEVSVDEHTPSTAITLQPRPAESLRGRVVNGDGVPVTGAIVYPDRQLEGGPSSCNWNRKAALAEQTDETGTFTFPALWSGHWRFNIRAQDYATKTTEFVPTGGDEARFVIDRGSAIRGTVVRTDTGNPIPGVRVDYFGAQEWDKKNATTNDSGQFEFTCVEPGDRSVGLNDARWAPLDGLTRVTVPVDRPAEDVVIRASEGATLSGRIYDAGTQQGVPGVKVYVQCRDIDYYRTSEPSDATGRYTITGLSAGAYTISRSRFIEGYPFPEEPFEPELDLAFGEHVIHDIPMSRGISITGRITDPNGAPIRGAQLSTIVGDDRHQYEYSKADGSFTLMGYRSGDTVTINVEKEGFGLSASSPITIRDTDVSRVDIMLEPEAFVEGVIVDGSGRPLPHAKVLALAETKGVAFIPTTTSGTDGRFVCGRLRSGSYKLSVEPRGAERSVDTDTTVSVVSGERLEGIRVVCPAPEERAGFQISGRVVDAAGKPVVGATVRGENYAAGSRESTTTDEDGRFTLNGLAFVRYDLRAYTEGEEYLGGSDGIPAGTTNAVIVSSANNAPPGTIAGRVVRADTGEPIQDFDVNAKGNAVPVHDREGRFQLHDLPAGDAAVWVRAKDFLIGYEKAVVAPVGQLSAEVVVRLRPAARMEGLVQDASGTPLQGARIFVDGLVFNRDDPRSAASETRDDGVFAVDGLDPRGALIAIVHPTHAPLVVRVAPSEMGAQRQTFTVGSGGEIEGTVRYDGRPVPDSIVWVYMADLGPGAMFNGRTDKNGMYRIADVPPGAGEGGARLASGYEGLNTDSFHVTQYVTVQDGEVTCMDFDFLPQSGVLEGIVSLDGVPIDASVRLYVTTPSGEQQMNTFADLSGAYRFDRVPPGDGKVVAIVRSGAGVDGSKRAMVPVKLVSGTTTQQDISRKTGASVAVYVANLGEDESTNVFAYFGDVRAY